MSYSSWAQAVRQTVVQHGPICRTANPLRWHDQSPLLDVPRRQIPDRVRAPHPDTRPANALIALTPIGFRTSCSACVTYVCGDRAPRTTPLAAVDTADDIIPRPNTRHVAGRRLGGLPSGPPP
jgi:hypothetical protein